MAFAIGLEAIKALCQKQSSLDWQRAKLSEQMFSAYELPAYKFVAEHLKKHHALPNVQTLEQAFPSEVTPIETLEPPSYYLAHLENRFAYQQINKANLESQGIL